MVLLVQLGGSGVPLSQGEGDLSYTAVIWGLGLGSFWRYFCFCIWPQGSKTQQLGVSRAEASHVSPHFSLPPSPSISLSLSGGLRVVRSNLLHGKLRPIENFPRKTKRKIKPFIMQPCSSHSLTFITFYSPLSHKGGSLIQGEETQMPPSDRKNFK